MNLSLPAGPDARRRPSHLKGFLRLLPFLLAAMGLAWLALDGLVFRESARHMRDLEMDGYALCGRIREDASLARLPVYAVTADVEAGKAMEGKGFDGLLLKPLTLDRLSEFLSSLPRAG